MWDRFSGDETGQTTMEYIVLTILIVMSMIVIGLATGQGLMAIWDALVEKIGDLLGSFSI